jgi:hypothetical protein
MSEIQISQPRITWLLVALGAITVMNTVPILVTYFEHRWPLVSLGAAASIWMFVAAQPRESWRDRVNPAMWLLFSAYLLHGFEVDGIDLLGREFYFQTHVLETRGIELTAGAIMRMNTVSMYLFFLCAIWGGDRHPFAGLAAAGLPLINGLMHTINSVTLVEYTPGLATSLLLFLPGATWYMFLAHRIQKVRLWQIAAGIGYALFGHVALLPLCVMLDSPIWLMAGFPIIPLVVSVVIAKRRDGAGELNEQRMIDPADSVSSIQSLK